VLADGLQVVEAYHHLDAGEAVLHHMRALLDNTIAAQSCDPGDGSGSGSAAAAEAEAALDALGPLLRAVLTHPAVGT
jgi:hypothetical protein